MGNFHDSSSILADQDDVTPHGQLRKLLVLHLLSEGVNHPRPSFAHYSWLEYSGCIKQVSLPPLASDKNASFC